MLKVSRRRWFDETLWLLLDGYEFIAKRCERYRSNVFDTRLIFFRVTCMRGEEAARLFYDTTLFKRKGAMPRRVRKTLVGEHGVQGLDNEAHRGHKQMLMSLMTPEHIRQLAEILADQWRAYVLKWTQQDKVNLFDELNEILCRAVCAWASVPIQESEVKSRTQDFMAIIDGAGAVGLRHWRGRLARKRLNAWLAGVIDDVRDGESSVPHGSAAEVIAWHREPDGKLLDRQVAADELNNMIRPTVALSRYMVFEAHALHEHPQYREKLQQGTDEDYTHFIQEVRRFYPFFPAVTAIVKQEFEWKGHRFPKGRWVLLDLYGTGRDPQSWHQPDRFWPERFRDWSGSAFNFIPQGGGNHFEHHRCAGEWITIVLMKTALRLLTQEMDYDVPPQDLRINLSRIPAIPHSRFVIGNVRLRPAEPAGTTRRTVQAETATRPSRATESLH